MVGRAWLCAPMAFAILAPSLLMAQEKAAVPQPTEQVQIPVSEKVDFGTESKLAVPANDTEALALSLKAIKKEDFGEFRRILSFVKSKNIRDAILWRAATNSQALLTNQEIMDVLERLEDFPDVKDLRIKFEKQLNDLPLSEDEKLKFLQKDLPFIRLKGPLSGEGQMLLAKILLSRGKTDEARKLVASAFSENTFDSKLQTQYQEWFSGIIDTQTYDKRADLLLWLNKQSMVKYLLPFLSPQMRINANIRMGLANEEGAVITGKALDDRGITYERVKSLRKQNLDSKALDLLLTIDAQDLPNVAAEFLWEERRRLLVEALKTKRYSDAYKIISSHGITSGSKQSDAELMAGWIALRLVNEPQKALSHFEKAQDLVITPAFKAKAYYWLGRTYEALNNPEKSRTYFDKAAQYPTYYYGQLAAARNAAAFNQTALLTLPPEIKPSAEDFSTIGSLPMVEIANAFASIGERELFGKFVMREDDFLKSNIEHQTLSEIAKDKGEYVVAMRVAKSGMLKGMLATNAAFPVIQVPKTDYQQAELAFTHAIIRQETEFNPAARSKVGALGLMQFMPATAASQAKKLGIPHQTSWLVSKPEHSLILGSTHLADLTERFYGSYVLAIVGYNAGPNRSMQWIDTYGEIRGEDPDKIIDWVEMIPFTETRDYVQKVLENLQVYRTRLYGDNSGIQILNDLSRGTKPPPVFKVIVPQEVYDYVPPAGETEKLLEIQEGKPK